MNDLLKNRMAATKQASELAASDEAYQQIGGNRNEHAEYCNKK